MPNLMRSVAVAEHIEMAGGEELCSDGARSKWTTGFRRASGDTEVRFG